MSPGSTSRPRAGAVEAPADRLDPAGFWLRFWAWLFDTTVLGLILAGVNYVTKLLFGVAVLSFVLDLLDRGMTGSFGAVLALFAIFIGWLAGVLVAWFLGQVVGWIYYALFESSGSRATPGKMLLSLWVVDAEGEQISFSRATLRHVLKFAAVFPAILSFLYLLGHLGAASPDSSAGTAAKLFAWSVLISPLLFFIFYGMAGWTRDKRALHDIGSGCYVVRAQELTAGRRFGVVLAIIALFLVCQLVTSAIGIYRTSRSLADRPPETARARNARIAAAPAPAPAPEPSSQAAVEAPATASARFASRGRARESITD